LTIDRDVANANWEAAFQINWTAFEQATDLEFLESFGLADDDTGQDGDNLPIGDDSISLGPVLLARVSSNGQASTQRTRSGTIAFANLDKDADPDSEIRAIVTLTPQLPVSTSRESAAVTVVP
jgi:hypothetical protein